MITPVSLSYPCSVCHKQLENGTAMKCSRCKSVVYCGAECQKKDWKSHKIVCFDSIALYKEENNKIRYLFSTYKQKSFKHVSKTRELILQESSRLNPEKSTVVVCGAQYFDNEFIEPLPELLNRCKKLVLLDIDPATLDKLHEMLGRSPKVAKVAVDLSASLKLIPDFCLEIETITNNEYAQKMLTFLLNVAAYANTRAPGLPGVLEEGETADLVISSLVASQLGIRVKEVLFTLYANKFKEHISNIINPVVLNKLATSLHTVQHALSTKHLEDLCIFGGEKGRIYFADTITFNNSPMLTGKTCEAFEAILRKRWGDVKISQWQWNSSDCDTYDVNAYTQ